MERGGPRFGTSPDIALHEGEVRLSLENTPERAAAAAAREAVRCLTNAGVVAFNGSGTPETARGPRR